MRSKRSTLRHLFARSAGSVGGPRSHGYANFFALNRDTVRAAVDPVDVTEKGPLWRYGRTRPKSYAKPVFAGHRDDASDDVECLSSATALFMRNGSSTSDNHLSRVINQLLDGGRSDVISSVASLLHSAGDISGQNLINKALGSAQSGNGTSLFAIPISFSSEFRTREHDSTEADVCLMVENALKQQSLTKTQTDFVVLPTLLSHSQLSALGVQGVRDLRSNLEDSIVNSTLPMFGIESLEVDEPRFYDSQQENTLRWAVGLCRWDANSPRPGWLEAETCERSFDSMNDIVQSLAQTISLRVGKSVAVGTPLNLLHQLRHGAVNEAANSLYRLAIELGSDSLKKGRPIVSIRIRTLDSSLARKPPPLGGLTRVHIELHCGDKPAGDLKFDILCFEANAEIDDLLEMVHANCRIDVVDDARSLSSNHLANDFSAVGFSYGQEHDDDEHGHRFSQDGLEMGSVADYFMRAKPPAEPSFFFH